MPLRRVELIEDHPLHRIATMAYDAATGDVEVTLVNGQVGRENIGPQERIGAIVRTVFHTRESLLIMYGADGAVFTAEVGRVTDRVDRPVVYLDQNHWIDLARALTPSPKLDVATRDACDRLIQLARASRIILPLSASHVVETAKKGGRQRLDVAKVLVELSRGWQMSSPLAVRARELDSLFVDAPATRLSVDGVFTLAPEALWADRLYAPREQEEPSGLPAEMKGLLDRITWIASVADVVLEATPEVSAAGVAVASSWAASFQELAAHIRANPKAKRFARDLTRTRFVTDMAQDLALAAGLSGESPDEFERWLQDRAEEMFSALPALGRVREVPAPTTSQMPTIDGKATT